MFQLQEIFTPDQPPHPPQDLQFEERELTVRNSYNAESLYEWNIDGMSQYEILNELHEILWFQMFIKVIIKLITKLHI